MTHTWSPALLDLLETVRKVPGEWMIAEGDWAIRHSTLRTVCNEECCPMTAIDPLAFAGNSDSEKFADVYRLTEDEVDLVLERVGAPVDQPG